jgi:hypothetical protein
MSNTAVTAFLKQLVASEALREQVMKAEAGKVEKAAVLIEVGARRGLQFTKDELADVLDALHRHKIGELSEEELIATAGSLIDFPNWHPDHE